MKNHGTLTTMNLSERLARYLRATPKIDASAYIHPTATIIGDVVVGPRVSIWPGAVLRGDINAIIIEEGSNVQDQAVIHVADDYPCTIGKNVVIGHGAVVHACDVGDHCLIGIQATVLDGAKIGKGSLIGAGALVPKAMEIPAYSMAVGVPCKVIRERTQEEVAQTIRLAQKYQMIAQVYRELQGKGHHKICDD